jgi:hypothetical protein
MGYSLQCGTCDSIFGVLRAVRQNLLMHVGVFWRNHQSTDTQANPGGEIRGQVTPPKG